MEQERKQTRRPGDSDESGADQVQVTESKAGLDDDVDAILAEIDEVLEVNAEDFVRSFIQKGGQ